MSAGSVAVIGGGVVYSGTVRVPLLQLPNSTTPKERVGTTDDDLAIRIQKALTQDSRLEAHRVNLLVNVIDGVAVIGGPVPDDNLLPVIEQVAQSVSGVRSVKVSVWTQPNATTDPLIGRVGDSIASRPRKAEPSARPTTPVLSLPTETVRSEAPTSSPILLDPVVNTTVARNDRNSIVPGATPPPYPNIPPTNLPTKPIPENSEWSVFPASRSTDEIDPSITRLQQSAKYAHLTVNVRNGVATVGGNANNRADVWDFAASVRELPSVQRVVIGEVTVRR